MVVADSMAPGLQLVWAQFSNFLLTKLSREFKLHGMSISWNSNGHISILREAALTWSGMLVILHVLCMLIWMILTWSKVKVKVIDLLKFRKLHFSTSTSSAILAWRSQVMGDCDSMGPSLQLFRANFWISPPVGSHVTSKFTKCWYHQNSLRFISALAKARSLWLWLQVGCKKPCKLASMTVSPLVGLFMLIVMPDVLSHFHFLLKTVSLSQSRYSKHYMACDTFKQFLMAFAYNEWKLNSYWWYSCNVSRVRW